MQVIRTRFTIITAVSIIISIVAAGLVSMQYFRKASDEYMTEVLVLKCSNICRDINSAGGKTSVIVDSMGNDRFFSDAAVFVESDNGVVEIYPAAESGSAGGVLAGSVPAELPEQPVFRFDHDGNTYMATWNYLKDGSRLILTVPYSWSKAHWLSFVLVFSMIAMLMIAVISLAYEKIASGVLGNLNDIAYKDALTSVRNKSAFDNYISKMDQSISSSEAGGSDFAICYFDCNSLKEINDTYGHDKGDIYLKTVCSFICHMFMHSPVFRIGGDEFVCILKNDDFKNREKLLEEFDSRMTEINGTAANEWDKIDVARGIAVYDAEQDSSVEDVFKRADALMYEDKQRAKTAQAEARAVMSGETLEG